MTVRIGFMLGLLGLLSGYTTAQQTVQLPDEAQPAAIKTVMAKVADWQLANPSRHPLWDWTHGALFAGMAKWAQMADDETYYKALKAYGEKTNWQLGPKLYHADDHAVGQMYIELYKHYKDPKIIEGTKRQFDRILADPSTVSLHIREQKGRDRYWWCDSLFMAPPVWAKLARVTGDQRYLEFMDREWQYATDYLYDTEEHLYFRDENYFNKREANGEKIFWSRGNGWVFGGLVRVLEEMPENYPNRVKYETLYREMAAKLMAILPEDGLWHPSLLDPVTYSIKETSGSGFYIYGLAWGINHGYLDDKALPLVLGAWKKLTECVQPDGKLGYVQPIGGDPQHVKPEQTEIYGVGAFLLAGSEIYKIAVRSGAAVQNIAVSNPLVSFRDSETVSLNWKELNKAVSGLTSDNAAVFDFSSNRLLVTQIVEDDNKAELLFQTNLAPGQTKIFWVMKQPAGFEKPYTEAKTYCRFAPDRKDDFLWENDKAAYRVYGPALEYETITSGIDAWGKSVPYPVVDKFLEAYNKRKVPYHDDHGEGGDFYKVGNTLGCGGLAPFVGNKVILPRNFVTWKVLANGPIRSTFELTYKPWEVGSGMVSETKRYSIDLGSNLSRIECRYASATMNAVPLAAGIILRETSDKTWADEQTIAYWLPSDPDGKYGWMGCGVIVGPDNKASVVNADNHILLTFTQNIRKPVVYYSGSCWDKNKEFDSFEKWQNYLGQFRERLNHPLVVTYKK